MSKRILVQITHPAHAHFFRYFIQEAQAAGHRVHVCPTGIPMVLELLDAFDIEYEVIYHPPTWDFFHIRTMLNIDYRTYRLAKKFDPDVMTSIAGTNISHVSQFVRGKSIVFYDTEVATLQNAITYPFADEIHTPDCYQGDIGSQHVRYPSYHELAYLHPNRFSPDSRVLEEVGLTDSDRFVILRLVAWDAMHDIGDSGFHEVESVVQALEQRDVEVIITSEDPLPTGIESRRATVAPHRMHDLMYYADLYIGESATMATESAVLGTPAVFVSTNRRGYTDELEERYDIVFNFSGRDRQEKGLEKSLEILEHYDPGEWQEKRQRILADKIDTTSYIAQAVLGESDTAKDPITTTQQG